MTSNNIEWAHTGSAEKAQQPSPDAFASVLGWGEDMQRFQEQRPTSWLHEWDLQVVLASSLLEHQHLPDDDLKLIPWARAVSDLQYHIQTSMTSAGDAADSSDPTIEYYVTALQRERAAVSIKLEQRMHGATYSFGLSEEQKHNGGGLNESEYEGAMRNAAEQKTRRESIQDANDTDAFLASAGVQGPPKLERILHDHAKAQRALVRQRQRLAKAGSRVAPKVMEELYLLARQEIRQGNVTLDLKTSRSAQRIFSRLPVREAHVIAILAEQIMRENRVAELQQELEAALQVGTGTETEEKSTRVVRERVAEEEGDWVWSDEMNDWVWAADGYEWMWSVDNEEWDLVPSSAMKASAIQQESNTAAPSSTSEAATPDWEVDQTLEPVSWQGQREVNIQEEEEPHSWPHAWQDEQTLEHHTSWNNEQETKVQTEVEGWHAQHEEQNQHQNWNDRTEEKAQQNWDQWQTHDDERDQKHQQQVNGHGNALQPPPLDNLGWQNHEWQGAGDMTLPPTGDDNFSTTFSAQQYPPSPTIRASTNLGTNRSTNYNYVGVVGGIAVGDSISAGNDTIVCSTGGYDGDGNESDGTDEEEEEQSDWVSERRYSQNALVSPQIETTALKSPQGQHAAWAPE